jgi:N-acetyltransferase 10
MNIFVSSHYKNTPNDLQLLSDAPAHQVFTLLGPIDEKSSDGLPDILCAIQVCYEGEINKKTVTDHLQRG